MFETSHLLLLQQVALTGSYSAAGRALGFTQPAITYQMKALERAAGCPLFVRMGRTMRLTPTGRALLVHAEQILAALRAAQDHVAALTTSGSGRVRLAAFPSACATIVPTAIVQMRASHPEIEVQLVQVEPPEARAMLRNGDVDLALCYRFDELPPPRRPASIASAGGLVERSVLSEDVRLVLPADHPAAGLAEVGLEDVADATFLTSSEKFVDMINAAAAIFGFTPDVTMVADDYVVMQALVCSGFGLAFVPELALRAHCDPRVAVRPMRDWPRRHVQIEFWPDTLRVDAVQLMIEHLSAAAD